MRSLFVLVISSALVLTGCPAPEPEIKLIPLTTSSPEAEKLMKEVMLNSIKEIIEMLNFVWQYHLLQGLL